MACLGQRGVLLGMIGFLLIPNPRLCAGSDDAMAKRFLGEAPQKWREYQALLRGFEVRGEYVPVSKKYQARESFRLVLGQDGMRALDEIENHLGSKKHALLGSNPEYSFELRQPPAAANGQFSIYDLTPRNPEVESRALRNAALNVGMIWRVGWLLDLLKIVGSSDFHVTGADEVSRNGRRFVEIRFDYQRTNPEPKEESLPKSYAGTLLFAPDDYWALCEAKINIEDPEVRDVTMTQRIERAVKNLPVVTEKEICWYDLKGDLFQTATWTYRWKEFTGGDQAFTLSAFEFPEPGDGQPTRSRLWLLCAASGLVLIGVLLLLRRRG